MMIRNFWGILTVLIIIECVILCLSGNSRTRKFFKFPPAMFWIYFLPMIFSSLGVIPQQHDLYPKIGTFVLPVSLILLLLSADLRAMMRLGKTALGLMAAGALGIMLGAPLVILLFKPWLPADAWSGFAALSASWTGGSANMIAVKEALGTPDRVFLPMVVVDTLVAYSWMGILLLLAGVQTSYDRWNHSDRLLLESIHQKINHGPVPDSTGIRLEFAGLNLLTGVTGAVVSIAVAQGLYRVTGLPLNTGVILMASTIGIGLSLTPAKKLEAHGASKMGYALLYFVLTSIGARASLSAILAAPLLVLAGFVWVLIHAIFMILAGRLTRAPMGLLAAASQANIGGPASAPVVAAIYEPALAPVGLLLGVLGNVIGTYCGLLCAPLCKWAFFL